MKGRGNELMKDPVSYCWEAETHTGIGPTADQDYFSTFKYLPNYFITFAATFFISTIAYQFHEGRCMSHLVNVPQEVSQKKGNPNEAVQQHRAELIIKATTGYFRKYFVFQIFQLIVVCCNVYLLTFIVLEYPKLETFWDLFIVFNPFKLRRNRQDKLAQVFPKIFGCQYDYFNGGKQMSSDKLMCYTMNIGILEVSVVILNIIFIATCILALTELMVTVLKLHFLSRHLQSVHESKNFILLEKLNYSQRLQLILLEKNIDCQHYYNVLEILVMHPKLAGKNSKSEDDLF